MKIPIRNLYYLFLYAWAQIPDGSVREAGIADSPDLPNLFARMLAGGTRKLLRRGIDRGYKTFTHELVGPRGRLRLDRMTKEATQLRGTAICDFDELTHDSPHNRILKATLACLAGCPDVEHSISHDLRALGKHFLGVEDILLSASHFRQVSLSRNNRQYLFLMRLCDFVFRSLMPDEHGATERFETVLEDEVRMSVVFENFLRNFFQFNRSEYRVGAEWHHWHVTDTTPDDLALLPRMKTDITLRQADHTIIIDAKYHQTTLATGLYGERVKSDNLYQLITYLQHERTGRNDNGLSGLLLYPYVGRSLFLKYRLLGIPVLVATIDLSQEWRAVEVQLHKILTNCAEAARLSSAPVKQLNSTQPRSD